MSTIVMLLAVVTLHLQRCNVMAKPAELASHPDHRAELERREDVARPHRPTTECVRMAQVTVLSRSRSRITMKCGLPRGHSEYAVGWLLPSGQTFTGQDNAAGPRNARALKFELLRKGSLRVHSIKPEDSGEYRCIHYAIGTMSARAFQPSLDATQEGGCTVTRLVVSVSDEEKPRMFYQNRTLTLGDRATLNCYTPGMMLGGYTRLWSQNGQSQQRSNHWQLGRAGVSLSLPSVSWTDAGTFRCQVANGSRRSIATIHVTVLDVQPDFAPRLVSRPVDREIRIQQSVVFTCTVKAKGLVQMRWKFCRAKVDPSMAMLPSDTRRRLLDRVSFEPSDGLEREVSRSVVIERVLDEDEGYYICLASNSAGTLKSYAFLRVT